MDTRSLIWITIGRPWSLTTLMKSPCQSERKHRRKQPSPNAHSSTQQPLSLSPLFLSFELLKHTETGQRIGRAAQYAGESIISIRPDRIWVGKELARNEEDGRVAMIVAYHAINGNDCIILPRGAREMGEIERGGDLVIMISFCSRLRLLLWVWWYFVCLRTYRGYGFQSMWKWIAEHGELIVKFACKSSDSTKNLLSLSKIKPLHSY